MKPTAEERQSINERIVETATRLGVPHLREEIWWVWDYRCTSRIADALYPQMRIRFARKVWLLASPSDRVETIDHEVAHLVDFHLRGGLPNGSELHGSEWRAMMQSLGYRDPSLYHHVDRSPLVMKSSVLAGCACGPRRITYQRAAMLRRGQPWICVDCDCPVILADE